MSQFSHSPISGPSHASTSSAPDSVSQPANTDQELKARLRKASESDSQEAVESHPQQAAEEPPQRWFAHLKQPDIDKHQTAPVLYEWRPYHPRPRLEQIEPAMRRVTSPRGAPHTWDAFELRKLAPELANSPDILAQFASMTSEGKAYVEDQDGLAALSTAQKKRLNDKSALLVRCVSLLDAPGPSTSR